MTASTRLLTAFACLAAGAAALFGCGGEAPADYGDWTLDEKEVSLSEDLRVSETENFFFGSVTDLDVTSDGRLVVADEQAHNIKVLSPDGSLVDTIGRSGTGPGEFRGLKNVQMAREDSLYAYDMRLSRLTVFAPNAPYEESRAITVSRQKGIPVRIQVLDEGFVARIVTPVRPEPGVSRTAPRTWRRGDESGSLGDTVLTIPAPRVLATDTGFRPIPLKARVRDAWGPNGRLYYGSTDSLHIEARSLDGSSEVVASIPTEPVPLTEAVRDSILKEVDDEMRSKMAAALPDTKPAFGDLAVADDGRLWVQRPVEEPGADTVPWWVLDPETKTIRETRLPEEVNLEVVQEDRAYGSTATEAGAPAVVRYRVHGAQ